MIFINHFQFDVESLKLKQKPNVSLLIGGWGNCQQLFQESESRWDLSRVD